MGTSSTARSDEQIQLEVLDELKRDAHVHPNAIGVAVQDGIVSLSGEVSSDAEKWAAGEAAQRVRGFTAVANDIEVRLPSSAKRSDADIAAAAVRTLESDALVPVERLDIGVSQGWATLQGEVEWEYQREDAEAALRRLPGVRGVTNLIAVRSRLVAADVKRQIEQALARGGRAAAAQIDVEVDGSKVTLKGRVHSQAERREAERAAWVAPGVASVRNRLHISY